MTTLFLFAIFSSILLISCLCAVLLKNSVHSVLMLILGFFNAAWLFLLLKAEFLAMMLIIIYVGAVMVLFLFVVMMIKNEKQIGFFTSKKFKIACFAVSGTIFIEMIAITSSLFSQNKPLEVSGISIFQIGNIVYTDMFVAFQTLGAIFFVGMVGAIMLTIEKNINPFGAKQQNISKQVTIAPKDCFEVKQVKTGEGVNL